MQFEGIEVKTEYKRYYDGNLAVMLKDEDGSPYATITRNLDEKPSTEHCGFVDTNNLGESVVKFIEKYNLGKFTGRYGMSGFCTYPEYEFNIKEEI